MKKVSFIIPCYRSENTIQNVVEEIKEIMNESVYDYEIVLVNDGSPDNVWKVIQKLSSDRRVIGIDLAKNFGQASAIMAGYSQAIGDYLITLDDDGQSPIDCTLDLIEKLEHDNSDVVYGICNDTKFNLFRKIGSRINGLMSSSMFGMPRDVRLISFYIIKKEIRDEICKYNFPYTYISGLIYRTTNRISYLEVSHRAREQGTSGYSLAKLIGTWLNGFTAFSIKPLRVASIIGAITAFGGFIYGIVTAFMKLVNSNINAGWSSLICIMLLLGGINLLVVGMVGEYIGRIYICINKAPQYVIHEIVRDKNDKE